MKPVMQTRTGNNPEAPGNCFSACVASILECSLVDLPDEMDCVAHLKREHGEKWARWPDRFKWNKSWSLLWDRTQEVLKRRGLFMLEVKPPFVCEPWQWGWCIIGGLSPRGILHAVVGRGMDVVFDPHPEGGGVAEADRTYTFFAAVDPARVALSP